MRSGVARKDYSDIQIHNVVTLATRVRITLLRVAVLTLRRSIHSS
jgi:hypothetical protein